MRCPQCERFVAYDVDVEPEPQGEPEVSGQSVVASFTRTLTCEDCGTELKEATIELDIDVPGGLPTCPHDNDGEHAWNVRDYNAESISRTVTQKPDGKPINRRGWRTFYGVELSVDLTCENCDQEVTVEGSSEEQASAFEELV